MNWKNQKGITMVAEVLTVIIFALLIGTITYSSMSSIEVRDLNDMYADILTIQEKAANYYLKYGEAPIDTDKPVQSLPGDMHRNPNDDDDAYYQVDFTKLLNVSLNEPVTDDSFYFINTKTLTVYHSKGVKIDGLINRALEVDGKAVYTDEEQVHYTLPSNYSNVSKIIVESYR